MFLVTRNIILIVSDATKLQKQKLVITEFLNFCKCQIKYQSVECLTAEREVAGSIPGVGLILRVFKITGK